METGRLTYWQAESLVVEGHLHKGKDICRKAGFKVVGNEKEGGWGMCLSVPIWLGPRRSRFVCLLVLLSSLILGISVSRICSVSYPMVATKF